MEKYRLTVDELPPWEDEDSCMLYEAPLCQDFLIPRATMIERIQELTIARDAAVGSGGSAEQVGQAQAQEGHPDAMQVDAEGAVEGTASSEQVMDMSGEDEDEDDLVRPL